MGAQNHINTGVPAYCARSMDPPPTSGAVNARESGTALVVAGVVTAGVVTAGAVTAGAVIVGALAAGDCTLSSPHADRARTPIAQSSNRRTRER